MSDKIYHYEQKAIKEKMKKCNKLAWNYHIHVVNGIIQATKEINIWIKDGVTWERIYHDSFCLGWTNCSFDKNGNPKRFYKECNEYLFVDGDEIQFNGGYLEIEDTGLIEHLDPRTDLVFDEIENGVLSKLFFDDCDPETMEIENLETGIIEKKNRLEPIGKNIHIEVEIEVEEEPENESEMRPVFYFPQNDKNPDASEQYYGAVYLTIGQTEKKNKIFWGISNMHRYSNPYIVTGMHRLVVSQDTNWLKLRNDCRDNDSVKLSFFEYYVNSVPLKTDPTFARENYLQFIANSQGYIAENNHSFGAGGRTFYVGNNPEDENGTCKSRSVFRGKIKRIFFDPNSACDGC